MENTVCAKCPWVKSGFCDSVEECPNYVETWWQEGQSGQTKLVKDCAPKRLMMQMQMLHARFEGVQAAAEQARNETTVMRGHFQALVDASHKHIEEQEKRLLAQSVVAQIEKKDC